jgi:hypothetical protein
MLEMMLTRTGDRCPEQSGKFARVIRREHLSSYAKIDVNAETQTAQSSSDQDQIARREVARPLRLAALGIKRTVCSSYTLKAVLAIGNLAINRKVIDFIPQDKAVAPRS